MESELQGNGKKNRTVAAAIDLGSNSFRLLICRIEGGTVRPLLHRLETVGLGKNLQTGGSLHRQSRLTALSVLRSFRADLEKYRPCHLRACGTEALRQASDSDAFLAEASAVLGVAIEILSGEEEARLTFTAVLAGFAALVHPLLVADVGGGSTELIFQSAPSAAPSLKSLAFGALSLTDRFPGLENGQDEARADVRRFLDNEFALHLPPPAVDSRPLVIGSGGTATALAALDLRLTEYDRRRVHGHCLSRQRLDKLFSYLADLRVNDRCRLFGLEKGRGRIILAGLEIFGILLDRCGAGHVMVSDSGLLEGILLSALPSNGNLVGL
jgi:exopolyphosphatase/guanosine-5'-triphosphate,3'-diphosphate pyrophosphatase